MQSHCQISTPREYVETMLDLAGYTENIYGKTFLENSCGEGGILVEAVSRYIIACRKQGYSDEEIKDGLHRDIKAYEIDAQCVHICKKNLDKRSKELGIEGVRWNITIADYLKTDAATYDFVVGNPPYITYHNLQEETRVQLKESFKSCASGRFDYYYAFIEKSVSSLKPGGNLVYLVPFSIFRNRFAQIIRDTIKEDIVSIVDYRGINVFDDVTASAAILHLIKGSSGRVIDYVQQELNSNKPISKKSLDEKWFFEEHIAGKRFGDYFTIQNSVATLFNDAFLITDYVDDGDFIRVGDKRIEKSILRNAVSTKSCKKKKAVDKIIFPYRIFDGGYERIPENEIRQLFPEALEYMKQYSSQLSNRKSSDGVLWYEYGRNQALSKIYGPKLIMSMVITTKVSIYMVDEEAVPYAGYFIKTKDGTGYDLQFAKNLLEAPEFYEYVKSVGTPTTETSYRISVKEIENYPFTD